MHHFLSHLDAAALLGVVVAAVDAVLWVSNMATIGGAA